MEQGFVQINPEQLDESAFRLIGTDWMLITPGTLESFNTMTASWGGLGVIWGKHMAMCVIRPQRHTYGFMEKSDLFTLSFFTQEYRAHLNYCGTVSGRDADKPKEIGLTAHSTQSGAVYFQEARIVLECRKIYFQDLNPENFIDPAIQKNYPAKDYHRMYIGEVLRCLVKQD